MSKKGLYGLLALLVVVALAFVMFNKNEQATNQDLESGVTTQEGADEQMPETSEPQDMGAEDDSMVGEDSMGEMEEYSVAQKDEFLMDIESKITEMERTLEEQKNKASAGSADMIAALEAQTTELENRIAEAKNVSGEQWAEVQSDIERQYEEIVQRFNETFQETQPVTE